MSLCDRCFAPGACCQRVNLSTVNEAGEAEPFTTWSRWPNHTVKRKGLPFRHLETVETFTTEGGERYETSRYYCPKVEPRTGRCTIYDHRPQLCRDFAPGSDPLCVHWRGAEGGESLEPVL